ncbi:MAG: hypothetical protein LBS11_01475 [Oscillospiraceae bacterium]|jgi:hypothetical protein|nr:hypothetical protein [Oscillospiraceae bacterium]
MERVEAASRVNKASRAVVIAAFWGRLACFALLCFAALSYAVYALTPKFEYGICGMVNLYRQKRNTVDALVLGTSLAYSGVNTNVLWAEYGIAAYDLCGAEQTYWNSYYYLAEALKTQTPKVILLDAKASTYQQDYTKRGRTILNSFGILSPVTRARAIAAGTPPGDALGYILAFPQIHANYATVSASDFTFPPGGIPAHWKGFIGADEREEHRRPSLVWTDTEKKINGRQLDYLNRILDLAASRGIPVMVACFPNPDYAADHMYYNALRRVTAERGADFVNFNEPSMRGGLLYTTDFADWQHMNIKGSVTFSRLLGETLLDMYALPDRRGAAGYASYDECLAMWIEEWPDYASLLRL